MDTLGALEAPTPALCHVREREREMEDGAQEGQAQSAGLHGNLQILGRYLQILGRCWQMLQQEPFFVSKALLRVSFPVNVTGPYGSIGNTCVNIPQVPVQKVNGGNTDSVHWKGRTEEVVRGRKVQSWSPFAQ